jgi:hypothetical protein
MTMFHKLVIRQKEKLPVKISAKIIRPLLACGAIGPLFFIVMFLIEGATRADYNPLKQPVSSLSIGSLGWMQSLNFIISGLLLLAFAVGLRPALRASGGSLWAPLLIAIVAIGLIGAGFFTTDPLNGYPPGSPLVPTVRTTPGKLHDLFSLPVFTALPAVCFVFTYRFAKAKRPAWAIYSALSAVGMFVAFVLAGMGFQQYPGYADVAGVYQRLSLLIGFGWIALLAANTLRAQSREPHATCVGQEDPRVPGGCA